MRRTAAGCCCAPPAERILVEDGRAAGVRLAGGRLHRAKAVISNADVRRTFLELVGREHLPADFVGWIEHLPFSTSAFAVFLAVDFVPDLEPVTVLQTEDGEGLYLAGPESSRLGDRGGGHLRHPGRRRGVPGD